MRSATVQRADAIRRETERMNEALSALVDDGESRLSGGDYVGARRIFETAVAHAERAHGDSAKELIVPLMGLARAAGEDHAMACAQMDRELEVQRRAVAIAEATLPADDLLLAECLHAHGVSVWANGQPAPAVALLLRALDVARRGGGDAHGYLGPLVGALLDDRRAAEALPHARELLRLEDASSPDLTTLFVVGQCFRDAGANEDARAVFGRFLDAFGDEGNPTIRDEVRGWVRALEAPAS
jgi:tetratricopeptide (TPR) repeat protein